MPTAQAVNRNVIAHTAPPPRTASVDTRIDAIQKNGSEPLATRQLHQIGGPAAAAGAAGGAAAIASHGGNPRVQVVGQNGQGKPKPLPLRAAGAGAQAGNGTPGGQTPNVAGKPGTPPNMRTLPAQTGTTAHGQPPDRTVTRGNETVGKGNATGNPNATGLPSSRFAPHTGPQGQAHATGETSTPRNNAVTTNNTAHQVNDRNAVTGRTTTTSATNAGNGTPSKTPPTVHRGPPLGTNVQTPARTTTATGTPPVHTESRTIEPKRSVEPTSRQYTPHTVTQEHTPPPPKVQQVQHAPPSQVQHAQPQVQVQHAPPPAERKAPPPAKTAEQRKKDKDDENGHR